MVPATVPVEVVASAMLGRLGALGAAAMLGRLGAAAMLGRLWAAAKAASQG